MITASQSAQAEFAAIVGAPGVVTDETARRALAVDGAVPTSVVYPRTAEEVAAILKCAAQHDLAVIPCRNATKLGVGNIPRRYDVALSLKEMNNVWHYEPADLTVSVEPGMKLGDFQEMLARNGLWIPLDPPGGPRASLGGILAANASGPLRLFYGSPRDMVLGMKVATTEGKIIKTGGRVVKNVAGYDLTKLLLGSYGSLGVIVEASFKLFPLPAQRATFVFRVPSIESARDLRRRIVNSPLTPMRMVLLNGEASEILAEDKSASPASNEFAMFVEAGGTMNVLDRYSRTFGELAKAAGVEVNSITPKDTERTWSLLADFRSEFSTNNPGLLSLRASLPIAATEEFILRAEQEADRTKSRMACLAQTAAGVVHLHFFEALEAAATIDKLRAITKELHGALVVEGCSPEIKSRVEVWGAPGNDFEVMRKIKQAWDPKGTLAPGRFVGAL
jgi:glycolate oxidase FAD binding subunit